LDLSSNTLTLSGNTAPSRTSGVIDADAGTIAFTNTSAYTLTQSIFSGSINNFTVNGIGGGITLAENKTITGTLALTNGNLTMGSNTLTVANFSTNSGTITGGTSSNLVTTASTTVPGITSGVNNFTVSSGTATLGGNITVSGTLAVGSNSLATSSNSITLAGSAPTNVGGGTINTSSGTIIFTNTSAIALPASIFTSNTVNNCTMNGAGGVTLGGSTTISGSLVLSSGTLTVGANTLTLSSTSVTRTSGYIDASNASATMAFTNTSELVLPSSVFTGNVKNWTMNGVGGVTLGDALSITGTLTLTSGKLNTQGYTLSLGTSSANVSISGGSSSAYIVAYDNGVNIGKVKHYINSVASYFFPIGDASNYTPLTYSHKIGATLASGINIDVYTKPVKIPGLNPMITHYLNRFWEVTPTGITVANYDISYTYGSTPGEITGLGTLYPIKLSGTTWYKPTGTTFTTGTEIGTGSVSGNTLTWTGLDSFSSFGGAGNQIVALPIGLISFTGKNTGSDNELKWVTASEKNNNYFTIEKTIDGTIFDVLGVVNGAGTSNDILNYQFTDYNVSKQINYYRLKQTDFDGVSNYTDLISIDNRSSKVEKQIATITNILGQEVNENFRGLVIIVYTDGSSEKVIR
jgi:hypothetical protein